MKPSMNPLTTHESPAVRCYAFVGLVNKNTSKETLQRIMKERENDTQKVNCISGCIMRTLTVIEYMREKQNTSSFFNEITFAAKYLR